MKQTSLKATTKAGRAELAKLLELPTLREHQNAYVRGVLAQCGGSVSLAAHVLGIGQATLYRRMAVLGLEPTPKMRETRAAKVAREFAVRAKL